MFVYLRYNTNTIRKMRHATSSYVGH